MKILFFLIFIFLIFEINGSPIKDYKIEKKNMDERKLLNNNNIVHFIKCENGDSILIESKGKYGLIDSSNPFKYIKNEVEPVQIDELKGERHQWSSNPDESVQTVINYLDNLEITRLDFIIGTYPNSGHIGGIPAIAYKFGDNSTKYYYRKYRETLEDNSQIELANYKYYLAAIHSMEIKGAELIDVTNKNITFNFNDFTLELLNTYIESDELSLEENQNSIVVLLKYKDSKLLLVGDMTKESDKTIKDNIGKIDILKLSHKGYCKLSYEFLLKTKPNYIIISNTHIKQYTNQLIIYIKNKINSKIYLTENISGNSKNIENSAIKLNFNEEKNFNFINTGEEVIPDKNGYGWYSWCDKWTYLENGKAIKGWKKIKLVLF